MSQFGFTLFCGVTSLTISLIQCSSPDMDPIDPKKWGNWFYSGWSDEQWNPIIGAECTGVHCNNLRVLTHNAGIIQGSPKEEDFYDTEVFSDPANWEGLASNKVECKKDYIVTRVWCNQTFCNNLKLRCTKLKHLSWCTRETCDGDYRYWTEVLSNESRNADRSERRCKPGTVLIGMECTDSYFCGRKRLLCEAMTPPSRHVSVWWNLYQMPGGGVRDIYRTNQTSKWVSDHIFGTEETWSIAYEGKLQGSYKDYLRARASIKMTSKYEHSMFEQLKNAYAESLTAEDIMCEPKCHEEGKKGFLWMTRVDLVDGTNTSWAPVDSLGFFQPIPGCLVQCVSEGLAPKCPPKYCMDDDCQCCHESMKDALTAVPPTCDFMSAAVQQHCNCQLFVFILGLLGAFVGTLQRFS